MTRAVREAAEARFEQEVARTVESLSHAILTIIDFGLSFRASDKAASDALGTSHYRAPEATIGAPISVSVDIWSLGCVVYEMMTGELLFNPGMVGTPAQGTAIEDKALLTLAEDVMGQFPLSFSQSGRRFRLLFSPDGRVMPVNCKGMA